MERADLNKKKARKIAREKVEFIQHFFTYSIVMFVLAVINNVTDPGGYQWWLWPATCWGIFLCIDFLGSFVFVGNGLKRFEKQLFQKELEKMEIKR